MVFRLIPELKASVKRYPSRAFSGGATLNMILDTDSPLKGRIKMFQDEKNKWITNDQAVKYLVPLFPLQHSYLTFLLKQDHN